MARLSLATHPAAKPQPIWSRSRLGEAHLASRKEGLPACATRLF
jgi:hypothetical protein